MTAEIVHAVMYRDYKIGTICDSRAWGPPTLFTMVVDNVTCPGCRDKLEGVRTPSEDAEADYVRGYRDALTFVETALAAAPVGPPAAGPDLDEIDRNARAYGWEIGHGHPLAEQIESTDPENPFLSPDWREQISATAASAARPLDRVRVVALAWIHQPGDGCEDTAQQIKDGHTILRLLDGGA